MAITQLERLRSYDGIGLVRKEVPNLFSGIHRVLIASENTNKINALDGWIASLGLVSTSGELNAEPMRVVGEEPTWENAALVSQHKVDILVRQIRGQDGGPALVAASDVVFWLKGQPRLNLSRNQELCGGDLNESVIELQRIFSGDETECRWDVATSFSRKGFAGSKLKATVMDVVKVRFSPIPPELIRDLFYEDVAGALGRNSRLPLVDDGRLQKYINSIEILSGHSVLDSGGQLKGCHQDYVDGVGRNSVFFTKEQNGFSFVQKDISRMIVGGMPRNERLDQVLGMVPRSNSSWRIV